MKCSFSKINPAFFCPALFYSTFISTPLKVALKNLKRMLLVDRFDRFFCFLNWLFKAFLLNWLKNLRAQFGLYRKGQGSGPPGPLRYMSLPVCLCLKTNWSDLSFAVHKFWKSNVQWNVLLRKEKLFHARYKHTEGG